MTWAKFQSQKWAESEFYGPLACASLDFTTNWSKNQLQFNIIDWTRLKNVDKSNLNSLESSQPMLNAYLMKNLHSVGEIFLPLSMKDLWCVACLRDFQRFSFFLPLRPFHRYCESCSRTQLRHISCVLCLVYYLPYLRSFFATVTWLFSSLHSCFHYRFWLIEMRHSPVHWLLPTIFWLEKERRPSHFCTFQLTLEQWMCRYFVVKFGVLGLAK